MANDQGGVTTIDGLTFTRYGDDACARSAASSASSVIPMPRPSRRSACMPSSTAARKRPASSPTTASKFHSERRMGLVGDNFSKAKCLARLKGRMAIGHNRYSTTGEPADPKRSAAVCRYRYRRLRRRPQRQSDQRADLRRELISSGAICQSTSDTEVILHLLSRSKKRRVVERLVDAIRQIEGSYALVCLTNDMMIGARDPVGIRPLVIGRLGDILRAGVRDLRARYRRRRVPARSRKRRGRRHHRRRASKATGPSRCARRGRASSSTSISRGPTRSSAAGPSTTSASGWAIAARRAKLRSSADVVVPVPDSGVPAAIGFSQQSGIPFELGIIRNHYVGRTFIEPEQRIRQLGVKLKHSANSGVIRGNRVVLIDDSVVRGTTSKKIVQLIRDAGAREVHMRISSPPITHPDFYGIDTPSKQDLLAANMSISKKCASSWEPTAWRSCRSTGSIAPSASIGRDDRAPAVHRPLLHRRLPDQPDRSERRGVRRASFRCLPKSADFIVFRYRMRTHWHQPRHCTALAPCVAKGLSQFLAASINWAVAEQRNSDVDRKTTERSPGTRHRCFPRFGQGRRQGKSPAEGAHVNLLGRTTGALEEVDDEIRAKGGTATIVTLDLRSGEKGATNSVPRSISAGASLIFWLPTPVCAGPLSPLSHITADAWSTVIETNLNSNWRLIPSLDPLLRLSNAGRAVFLSSGAASGENAYWGPYAVSKAGLEYIQIKVV